MGLQSVPSSYSFLLLSPHAFPCTSVGSSHRLYLPSGRFHLMCCGVLHSLQGGYLEHLLHRISPFWDCRGIPARNFPPPSLPLGLQGGFSHGSPQAWLSGSVFPSLTHPRPVMRLLDLAGASCVCLHTGTTPAPLPFSLAKPRNLNQIQFFKDARI